MDFTSGHESIEIRYNTDLWGPYTFPFEDAIPSGTSISSVTVKAFQGKQKPADVLATPMYSGLTDVTALIIDPSYTPTIGGTSDVYVKFQYPGDTYKGEKFTVVFELTLDTSARHPFFFHYAKVY